MPLDAQAAAFVAFVESLGAPPLEELPIADARAVAEEAWGGPPSGVTSVDDLSVPGPNGDLGLRVYRPQCVAGPLPVLVWLHGGGWVLGSVGVGNHACEELARRTPCVVASVEYGLSPENTFPGPVDDCWAAAQWVSANAGQIGGRRGPIAVGGDSAGGHLAACVALRARDAGLPLALQLLVYPVTDAGCDTGSYVEFADGCLLTRSGMQWFWRHYLGDAGHVDHPEASVLRAPDLGGVAPAWVLTAECDPLRDEGEALADRLAATGVPVARHRFPGQLHGFFTLRGQFDATGVAHDMAAEQLRAAFARG